MSESRSRLARLALGLALSVGAALPACGGDKDADQPQLGATPTPPPAAVSASCEGRVPDLSAAPSVVSGTGSVTEDRWTVAMSQVLSGHANMVPQVALKNNNEELRIWLSTSPNSCGRVRNGIVTSGQPELILEMASYPGTKIEARSYPNVRLTIDGIPEGVAPGECKGYGAWPMTGNATNPRGTLEITALDAKHVAGTYQGAPPDAGGANASLPTVTIAFDVPFCSSQVRQAPYTCCLP